MGSSVAELQQRLFRQIGIEAPVPSRRPQQDPNRDGKKPKTRKDKRRTQRVGKKINRYGRQPTTGGLRNQNERKPWHPPTFTKSKADPQPLPRTQVPTKKEISEDEDSDQDMSDAADGLFDSDESDKDSDDDEIVDTEYKTNTKVSKAIQEKLAQDDADIEAFERKLGIRKGRKSLPQSFKEDGLGALLGVADEGDSGNDDDMDELKRQHDYNDWLSSKRRPHTVHPSAELKRPNSEHDSDDDILADYPEEDAEMLISDEENFRGAGKGEQNDYFERLDSDEEEESTVLASRRENPYVAPSTGIVVAKYVLPSLRKAANSDSEQRTRLQKNIQGLVNRLTDANILSIVQSIEEFYQKNARGDVTEIITDIILAQIYKPELLPDQFFVLTGGFTAAIYKVIGSSFGSHVLRRLVQDLARDYNQARDGNSTTRREASNLVNFLTQLYVFEVISCRIIFDYMKRFLSELSELNVELLLRICRMAGRMLRRDDPQALNHITSLLNSNLSKNGYENVSVRTKFMIETINDLKNSKSKGKGLDSAVVSEHVVRMKKRIGELKSQSRRLDGLAAMGMTLRDIEGADTDGKWWLVGASVPVKLRNSTGSQIEESFDDSENAALDNEDMDFVLPDYPQKARSQGFSTMAQIAIFTALMSANNFEHGYRQIVNLKLKRDDQLEIGRVLVQCVGSETEYNQFYAMVASQACSNNRLRFSFQDKLWKIFRGLGESLFGDDADDEETAESERMKEPRRLSNVARFYASLVADGSLGIDVLKPLDLPEVNTWTADFMEHFLVGLLSNCRGKGSKEDAKVEKVFGAARRLPAVAAGLHWFLRKKIRKSRLIAAKEAKKMERVRQKAQTAVMAMEVA